ncbi:hypothetical protein Tco_0651980, partial [Tanacetum coccineum]
KLRHDQKCKKIKLSQDMQLIQKLRDDQKRMKKAFEDMSGSYDFLENSDDEADERTSEEYLKYLEIEFHERALLANSKRFIKRKKID